MLQELGMNANFERREGDLSILHSVPLKISFVFVTGRSDHTEGKTKVENGPVVGRVLLPFSRVSNKILNYLLPFLLFIE